MDPRVNIIDKRLSKIKRVIAVSGGKGGIGKSTIAVTLALTLSKKGFKVGLLDLDFWGPSVHVLLGAQGKMPEEKKGLIPPKFSGVACMSIAFYSLHNALALRKTGFEYAVIELLAVTLWGSLDYLVLDMPPGIGDATLDVIRLMKKVEFCVVTTPSKVVVATVAKTLSILKELDIPVVGIVRNMKRNDRSMKEQLANFNVPLLGELKFDTGLETAIGNPQALLKTSFAKDLARIALKIEKYAH